MTVGGAVVTFGSPELLNNNTLQPLFNKMMFTNIALFLMHRPGLVQGLAIVVQERSLAGPDQL